MAFIEDACGKKDEEDRDAVWMQCIKVGVSGVTVDRIHDIFQEISRDDRVIPAKENMRQ